MLCSKNGNPLLHSNVLGLSLHPILKALQQPKSGAQALRRFRTTWFRKQRAPEALIRFRRSHANRSVTDASSKPRADVALRKQVAEQMGVGLEVPVEKAQVAPHCNQSEFLSTVA